MDKDKLLHEGKAKRVYSTADPELYIIEYKNTATALNGGKKEDFEGKGELNCGISALIFEYLAAHGIQTHFVRNLTKTSALVKRVEIVPLEVIIRNTAAGSFSARFGVPEGSALLCPTLEYCYKVDELGDPMFNDYHIMAMGLATREELDYIATTTFKINELLIEFFAQAGMKLVDFKIEYGRLPNGQIVLADEISPDSCRLWDSKTNEKLDKDRFRRNMGGFIESYQEVLRRIKK